MTHTPYNNSRGEDAQPPVLEWWYGWRLADCIAAGRMLVQSPDGRVGVIVAACPQRSPGDYVTPCGVTQPLQLGLLIGRIDRTHELWLCGAPWRANKWGTGVAR